MTNLSPLEQAVQLHREAIVIDGLNTSRLDFAQIARFRAAGVDAFHWTVVRPLEDWDAALQGIHAALRAVEQHADDTMLVRYADDILRAHATGKIGVILGLQNARPISDDLNRLDLLHRLGVRIIQITYNERNFAGDGCHEPRDGGLSTFGQQLVQAMNGLGILVDLSHCSRLTTLDAVEYASKPVAITHANVQALCPTPRNKSDEEMEAVAASGGIVGAVVWAPLSGGRERPTIPMLIEHIRHFVALGGAAAAAIGTDYSESIYSTGDEWSRQLPKSEGLYPRVTAHVGSWYTYEQRYVVGLETLSKLGNLTAGMIEAGMSEATIRGVLGGNFLRTFRAACG